MSSPRYYNQFDDVNLVNIIEDETVSLIRDCIKSLLSHKAFNDSVENLIESKTGEYNIEQLKDELRTNKMTYDRLKTELDTLVVIRMNSNKFLQDISKIYDLKNQYDSYPDIVKAIIKE